MKKTVALFVSLVLVLSSLLVCGLSASAETGSYLFDFETGSPSEFVTSSTASYDICTEDPHSGNYCLAITPSASDQKVRCENKISVEPNTDYTVSYWHRGTPYYAYVRVIIDSIPDSPQNFLIGKYAELDTWAYGELSFNTGSSESFNLVFGTSGQDYNFFIDDIKVEKKKAIAVDPDNLFPDSSFESGSLSEWTNGNNIGAISNFNPKSGSNCLRVNDGTQYSRVLRTVAVEPNTDYDFGFWYCGNTAWQQFEIRTTGNAEVAQVNIGNNNTFVVQNHYYSYRFNSGDNTALQFGFRQTRAISAGAFFFVDDLSLKKAPPADYYECGFETGSPSEFVTSSTASYDICTENPHSGSYCLAITPSASDQKVRRENKLVVEPNTDYTVSYWYRGHPYYGYVRVIIDSIPDSPQNFLIAKDVELDDWAHGELSFNSGSSESFILTFGTSGQGNNFYIDDIKVEKKKALAVDPDNIFPDGSFESGSLSDWSNANTIGAIMNFNPKSGSNCLRVNDGTQYSRVLRTVEVEPYTDYDFSFWYNGNTAWQQIAIRTNDNADIADGINISKDDTFVVENRYYTCRFNSGNNTELKFGFRQCRAPSKEAFFFIDDISLKKAPAKLTASTDGHGTVTWNPEDLIADNEVALNAIPEAGYKLYKATLSLDGDSLINYELNDQQLLVPEVEDDFTFVMSTVALKVYGEFTTVTDINSDGNVDIRDLIALKKLCASAKDAAGDPSDLDGSEAFDAADLTMIRQTLLGI